MTSAAVDVCLRSTMGYVSRADSGRQHWGQCGYFHAVVVRGVWHEAPDCEPIWQCVEVQLVTVDATSPGKDHGGGVPPLWLEWVRQLSVALTK